jgi:hypothetical protein
VVVAALVLVVSDFALELAVLLEFEHAVSAKAKTATQIINSFEKLFFLIFILLFFELA